LKGQLLTLLEKPEVLAQMAASLRTLARPDATRMVADLCLKTADPTPERPEA